MVPTTGIQPDDADDDADVQYIYYNIQYIHIHTLQLEV